MRIAIRLPGAMMPVILAERRQLFQPFINIRDQAVLGIVHPDAGGDVHGRNQDHAFLDAAFFERTLDLRGNIDIFAVLLRTKGQILGMEAHQSDDTPATRILVVDDEQQLLKVLTRYLAKLGYVVVASSSTEDAWERVQAAPEEYSLALIDATMSGLSAPELTQRILEANPHIKVIAASGYPITAEEFAPLDSNRVTFLHKPFSPDMLAELVRRLLAE